MNEELDIRAFLGPIRRQFRLIIAITFAIVAIAAIIGFSLTPKYEATALLYVNTDRSSLLDDSVGFANNSTANSKVASEVEIIKSDGVILDLIEELKLVQSSEFGVKLSRMQKLMIAVGLTDNALPSGRGALAGVTDNVRGTVSVQRRGLTYIISVSAKSKNPEDAAQIANALSNAYINRQLKSKVDNIEISLRAVQRQLQETEGGVVTTQKSLNNFIASNLEQIASVNGQTDLSQFKDNLISLRERQLSANSQKSWLLKGLGGGVWVSEVSGLRTQALNELEAQKSRITGQISRDNLGSIALGDLRTQLSAIDSEIRQETDTILASLNKKIEDVGSEISEFESQLATRVLSGDIELPDDISAQLYRLSQQSRNTTSQYQTLLAKAQELQAESLLQIPDTRVISPAIVPNSAVSPNLKLILAAALVFALGLAFALVYIIENYIGGFTTSDQVEAVTGKMPASMVRKLSVAASKSVSEIVIEEPLSIFSESIRKLRAGIQIALRNNLGDTKQDDKVGTVIMVSSAVPGEGKSSISLSLARTLAYSGARTIIIDCDIRKPSVASNFGISSTKGLANILEDEISTKTIAQNIHLDHMSNLHAILSDRVAFKDARLMPSFQSFETIIDIVKTKYDYVVLDTPPIGPVADALTLAGFSDVVVFVIRWAKTSQRSVLESLKLINAMAPNIPALTILNQVDEKSDNSYAEYSGYYSDG